MNVMRLPGVRATPMPFDCQPMSIAVVYVWPSVGSSSHVSCVDPQNHFSEQQRVSATILWIISMDR